MVIKHWCMCIIWVYILEKKKKIYYVKVISTHPRGQSGAEHNNRRDDDVGGALATVARMGYWSSCLYLQKKERKKYPIKLHKKHYSWFLLWLFFLIFIIFFIFFYAF